jgi:two-component system, sensor histidine kinase and response regulator
MADQRSLRVLVVDDNPVNQTVAARLLEREGHSVVIAENGRVALDRLVGTEFDMVLMDLQMPEMDGFAATAAIRRQEAGTGRRLPIVAFTANNLIGDRVRCLEAGMDGFVAKPVQVSLLLREMADVLAVA